MGNNESVISANFSHLSRINEDTVSDRMSTKSSDDEMEFADCKETMDAGAFATDGTTGSGSENKVAMADDATVSGETGSALDRLLQQQMRERKLELEAIQQSNKRVSDGKHMRRLERFFSGAPDHDNQSETASVTSDNFESSDTPGGQSSVVLEVRDLFQAQPVTSVLQSNNFRTQLEGIIRGNVVRQERELETALRLRNAGLPGTTISGGPLTTAAFVPPHQFHEVASTISSSTHSSGNIHPFGVTSTQQHYGIPPLSPPPPGIVNQYMPIPTAYRPQYQSHDGHMQPSHQPNHPVQYPPRPQVRPQQIPNTPPVAPDPVNSGVAPQLPWLLNRSNDTRGSLANQEARQRHREDIVMELSNLVQSQVVTSTLESNFRGQLELLMQNQFSQGDEVASEQVMNFIRNLPRSSNIVRNDFSHLGISAGVGQRSQMDHGATSGEMARLREQMAELQNMVKISFDLQLDLQRSIRQEVAAALHNTSGAGNTGAMAASVPKDIQPAEEGHCIICLDKSIDSVLYQCGHMCVCLPCGLRLKDLGSHCPMCRAPIRDVIRAFKCHEK